MAAARARWRFLALQIALFLAIGTSRGLVRPEAAPRPPVPKAISDLRDAIVKGLGFQSEELKVSGFDVRDALVGQAVAYEFDVEVGRKVVPVRLLEDVNLPIFRSQADADDTALAEIRRGGRREAGRRADPAAFPARRAHGALDLGWRRRQARLAA